VVFSSLYAFVAIAPNKIIGDSARLSPEYSRNVQEVHYEALSGRAGFSNWRLTLMYDSHRKNISHIQQYALFLLLSSNVAPIEL